MHRRALFCLKLYTSAGLHLKTKSSGERSDSQPHLPGALPASHSTAPELTTHRATTIKLKGGREAGAEAVVTLGSAGDGRDPHDGEPPASTMCRGHSRAQGCDPKAEFRAH